MRLRHIAAAALLLGASGAAMAEVLVVRATGPSAKNYPAGRKLADNARIQLQAGDQLVILSGRGTRTFRGPGTYTPTGPSSAAPTQTAAAAPQRRARIGAVRGTGMAAPRAANVWQVDVAKSSNVCLADTSNVTLWRSDAARSVPLSISGGGASRTIDWAAGQPTMSWPSDLPISEGASYELSWPGAAEPTKLKFRTLPEKPGGLEEMASSLIQNGCEAQLDTLIETVKLPDDNRTPAS